MTGTLTSHRFFPYRRSPTTNKKTKMATTTITRTRKAQILEVTTSLTAAPTPPNSAMTATATTLDPAVLTLSGQNTRTQELTPPASPYPWLWRCHSCYTIYRLACTRRCLLCSHTFCTGAPGGRKSRGPCKAEFDYSGWAAWGAWRRTCATGTPSGSSSSSSGSGSGSSSDSQSGFPPSSPTDTFGPNTGTTHTWSPTGNSPSTLHTSAFATYHPNPRPFPSSSPDDHGQPAEWTRLPDREVERVSCIKEGMYMRREHDCWRHCDFPSECRHAVYAACVEGRARAVGDGRRAVPLVRREDVAADEEGAEEGLVVFPGGGRRGDGKGEREGGFQFLGEVEDEGAYDSFDESDFF